MKHIGHIGRIGLIAGLVLAGARAGEVTKGMPAGVADANGYVTNANFMAPFCFTNGNGAMISNAVVTRVMVNKFFYRTADGAAGAGRWEWVATNVQARFGYDAAAASNADMLALDRNAEAAIAGDLERDADAQRVRLATARARAAGSATYLFFRVVQKLDEGLLVDCDFEGDSFIEDGIYKNYWTSHDPTKWNLIPKAKGMALLRDYPNAAALAEGDEFVTIAYPDGEYKYMTVGNALSTVHRYTSSVERAAGDALGN